MDLVASDRLRRFRCAGRVTGRVVLSPPSIVSTASSPSPATVPRPALDALGVGDRSARASGSRRKGRAPRRRDGDARRCRCPSPALPERLEVGDRRLRAGDEDQVAIARNCLARLDDHDLDIGLGAERVEVVEIGDARQARHRDPDARAGLRTSPREARARPPPAAGAASAKVRHDAERRPAGALVRSPPAPHRRAKDRRGSG